MTCTPAKGGKSKTITLSASKSSAVITGLKEGTSYKVSLKAYVTIDGEKYFGKPGKAVTSKAVKGKKANPLKVKVKALGNKNYKASAVKTVTFTVKVK